MPINKEPNYFVSEYQRKMARECPSYKVDMNRMVFDKDKYYDLFDVLPGHKAIGEASVTYLFRPDNAIPNIKRELGEPKIIIILRNPIKRAFSHYMYACELGFETLNFSSAMDAEEQRLANNWSSTFAYVKQGLFHDQVKAFKDSFKYVHVLLLDDLVAESRVEMKKLYEFLDVDTSFKNDFSEEYNTSGIPKSRILHNLLFTSTRLKRVITRFLSLFFSAETLRKISRKIRQLNQGRRLSLSIKDAERLREIYREDVIALGKLINRDLKMWLSE